MKTALEEVGRAAEAAVKRFGRSLLPRNTQAKVGLHPGSLVHLGKRRVDEARIRLVEYDERDLTETDLPTDAEWAGYDNPQPVSWINVDGLHDLDCIQRIGDAFGIHALTLEDVLNTGHRAKLEEFDSYIFAVLKMIRWDDAAREVRTEQLSLILGRGYLLTFQEQPGDVFEPVRGRIRLSRGQIRKLGPDYLAFALMDAVVDNYMVVLERLGEELEAIEEALEDGQPQPELLRRIHNLKREMMFVRRAVWPVRECLSNLSRDESPLVSTGTQVFFRDLQDHTMQVVETLEIMRDMANGLQDLYLSMVSNRMNEVMKVLTIIATIFIPMTFFAGIYGMNFENMPELKWEWGYPALWGVMIACFLGILSFFRKKRWL